MSPFSHNLRLKSHPLKGRKPSGKNLILHRRPLYDQKIRPGQLGHTDGCAELPPADCPQPMNCKRLMEDQVTCTSNLGSNMISSCALYIHEILIYNTLIGTQQGSLVETDQSHGLLFPPPWPWRSPLHAWHNYYWWNKAILVIAIHLDSAQLRFGGVIKKGMWLKHRRGLFLYVCPFAL